MRASFATKMVAMTNMRIQERGNTHVFGVNPHSFSTLSRLGTHP